MFSLFWETKFWTLKDEIQIRETDFGCFKYYEKKDLSDSVYVIGKKSYSEKHGTPLTLQNKRPNRLRDNLKELEHIIASNKVVYYDWRNENTIQIIFSSGLIANVCVDVHTFALSKITFDKYLCGKLLTESISDVIATRHHLIISYIDNQLTLINFTKTSKNLTEKLHKLEPKITHVELEGPSGRRIDRKLTCNISGDMLIVWWQCTTNEIYPWSPLVKDRDRANIHVYTLSNNKLQLVCYHRTEFEPVSVCFSKLQSNLFRLIEQKVSRKGDVTVESSSYCINDNILQRLSVTSIPMQTQICCHKFSPNEEKLALGCIDSSIVLYDEDRGSTHIVKAAFIPYIISWHPDNAMFTIANERSQFQTFDLALCCVKSQLISEDVTPANLVDLQSYFKSQPTMLSMKWNKKVAVSNYNESFIPNDSCLFLIFEHGPFGILNLIGGGGLNKDIHRPGLTADTLIRQYISWNQVDKAVNLLLSLNWNLNGNECLAGLYHITNNIFRTNLTAEKEVQLEVALGSYHIPLKPLTRSTEVEFGDQVHDLTRRFFHHLLRYNLYEKAFCLAIDLSDYDLFIDLYHCATSIKDHEMAKAAKAKAEDIISCNSSDTHSHCSRSSCSCSSYSDESSSDDNLPPLPKINKKSKLPPLPYLTRNRLRESAFFTRNTGFNENITTIPEEKSYEVETSFISKQSPYSSSFSPNLPVQVDPDWSKSSKETINVIEKLYDLPMSQFSANEQRCSSLDHLDVFQTQFDSIQMKPHYVSTPHILKTTILSPSYVPKVGSYDNLAIKPVGRYKNVNVGNSYVNGHASRLPNRSPVKTSTPSKPKVKFSDTVTQIMVPDISKLTIENEEINYKQKLKPSKKCHPNPAQELADSLPLCLSEDYLKNFSNRRDNNEDDDGHTIKVIHFGVV